MGQKSKFLVTNEGSFDLGTYTWDDQLFSDILIVEIQLTPIRPWVSASPCAKIFRNWKLTPSRSRLSKK